MEKWDSLTTGELTHRLHETDDPNIIEIIEFCISQKQFIEHLRGVNRVLENDLSNYRIGK